VSILQGLTRLSNSRAIAIEGGTITAVGAQSLIQVGLVWEGVGYVVANVAGMNGPTVE
jgi:hypothetical protein